MNIKNTIAEVFEKQQSDEESRSEDESKDKSPETPFIIASPTTTISFAITPRNNETIMPTLSKPSGLKINFIFSQTKYKIDLSKFPPFKNLKFVEIFWNNQTITLKNKIKVPTLIKNSFTTTKLSLTTFLKLTFLYFGISRMKFSFWLGTSFL